MSDTQKKCKRESGFFLYIYMKYAVVYNNKLLYYKVVQI